MTGRTVTLLAACVLLSSFALAQAPTTTKTTQSAGVAADAPDKALLREILDAWSTMNTENVRKYYDQSPDAVFYDITPLKFVGFKAYADGVTPMFATLSSLAFVLNEDVAVHSAGSFAWATATVKTVMTNKAGQATPVDCRWTVVWQRKQGAWVIVHDHFSAAIPG